MKKVVFSIFLAGVASFTYAQKSEISEAKKAWDLYQVSALQPKTTLQKKLDGLNEGIKHTDNAIVHEKTKGLPESWAYRALLTSVVSMIDTVNLQNAESNQKLAEEAIAKTKELDAKGSQKDNIKSAEDNLIMGIKNHGIIAYNKNDFNTAYKYFVAATVKNPSDTSMYLNAGIAARSLGKYPEMISQFKKVIGLNYPQSKDIYSEIINATLSKLKDTTAATAIIKEASAKYPDADEFIKLETQIYIDKGDAAKSEEMLNKLAAKEPNNAIYQSLLGNVYFTQALKVQNQRNKLDAKKAKEFAELTGKMNALLDKALPFYKKASELDPKSADALESLKQIYAFKNDTKNYEEIKKKLDALK